MRVPGNKCIYIIDTYMHIGCCTLLHKYDIDTDMQAKRAAIHTQRALNKNNIPTQRAQVCDMHDRTPGEMQTEGNDMRAMHNGQ